MYDLSEQVIKGKYLLRVESLFVETPFARVESMTVSVESISKTIFNDIKGMEKKPSDEGKAINDRIRRAVEDKLNLKSIGLRRLVRGERKLCSLVCKPKNVANR